MAPPEGQSITKHTPHFRQVVIFTCALLVGFGIGSAVTFCLSAEWTRAAWQTESKQVDPRLARIAQNQIDSIAAYAQRSHDEEVRRKETERRREAPKGGLTDQMVDSMKSAGAGMFGIDPWPTVRDRIAYNVGLLVLRAIYTGVLLAVLFPLYYALWEAGRARALARLHGGGLAVGRENSYRWAEVIYGMVLIGAMLVLPLPMAPATLVMPVVLVLFALVVYRYRASLGARV